MAQANGFETLMLKIEAKNKFKEAKKKIEQGLGLTITHSQAITIMCNKILSDSTGGNDERRG